MARAVKEGHLIGAVAFTKEYNHHSTLVKIEPDPCSILLLVLSNDQTQPQPEDKRV